MAYGELQLNFSPTERVFPTHSARFRVIAPDEESAAPFWSLRPEGRHDYAPSGFESEGKLSHIGQPLFRCDKEVEASSIMPNIVGAGRKGNLRHIPCDPMNSLRCRTEAIPGFPIAASAISRTVTVR